MSVVTDLQTYLFDLRGYVILEGALSAEEVAELNAALEAIPRLEPGQWYGHVHGHSYYGGDGLNYQQIYEASEPFERLIDHWSWMDHVKLYVGGEGSFDYHPGPLFIDECFANFRLPGEEIGLHSGGYPPIHRNQFRYHGGRFMCGQVNVLMALTDIEPGDGGTVVIPGSHKSNSSTPMQRRTTREPRATTSRDWRVPSSCTCKLEMPSFSSMDSLTAQRGASTVENAGSSCSVTVPRGETSGMDTGRRRNCWRD